MGSGAGLTTDLYQLTMAAAYLRAGKGEERATFELFVRAPPARRGYLLIAGLEPAVAYLEGLRFGDDEIAHLRGLEALGGAGDEFFDWLAAFRFRGDVDAMPEGTVAFAREPLLRVRGALPEVQILESYLLATIGFQTMVATKASRVVAAAGGRPVVDYGMRRAHGPEAGLLAARACFLAGCAGTSHVEAGRRWGIPVFGTCAHSFVLSFNTEEEAFRAWYAAQPDGCVLLLDTYDTVAAARRAVAVGPALAGVRLDSGDLATLAREVRAVLDGAGLAATRILASGDLDEYRIAELVGAGVPIDGFGVGTAMVTSSDAPALNIIYKLVEREVNGRRIGVFKISDGKGTLPGAKQVFRGERGDRIALADEEPQAGERPLLQAVLREGERAAALPALREARDRAAAELSRLPAAVRDLEAPAPYPVRLSEELVRAAREERR